MLVLSFVTCVFSCSHLFTQVGNLTQQSTLQLLLVELIKKTLTFQIFPRRCQVVSRHASSSAL